MLLLDMKPGEPERLELTAMAQDGVAPVLILRPPTTATDRAAMAIARAAVPGRDEGESEDDFRARLALTLAAWGADGLDQVGLDASVSGAIQAIALTAHARALITGWEGIGDANGEPISVSGPAIEALMRHPRVADAVELWIARRLRPVRSEGNGSAPSANTSSQGAQPTAGTAGSKGRRAGKAGGSTPSTTTKPRRRGTSARKSASPRKPSSGPGSSS